jgi:hypothetical protein
MRASAAAAVVALLRRLLAVSEMVSTANNRCHSLSGMRSKVTARGLSGCSTAAAAGWGASGDVGREATCCIAKAASPCSSCCCESCGT